MADDNRKSRGFLARLLRDRRGNTLAIAGAALVPIAGMIGSGLDMARAYMAEAKLQNACDAGALAARRVMSGTAWTTAAEQEGERFFEFNFPDDTMNAENVSVTIDQSADDESTVEVEAAADIPTTIMSLFGKDFIPISVACDADQDFGHNDIMLVLDVTLSMNCEAGTSCAVATSEHSNSRLKRLREGAVGLYNALAGATDTTTRYGMIPYSLTVNVGRAMRTRDILRTTYYQQSNGWGYDLTGVHIDATQWADPGGTNASITNWRQSGSACVEERPSSGNSAHPISISTSVSQADIDGIAATNNDTAMQWGRYDPAQEEAESGPLHASLASFCPPEATKLKTYNSLTSYQNAINAAASIAGGYTYHDIGIIWAARFLSRNGRFADTNPTEVDGVPVAQHIVFLTDGELSTSASTYSSYGVDNQDHRLGSSSSINARHRARFLSACSRAKSMGMTIWVIALDVNATGEIEPCATSSGHFYTSDGSDLEEIFEQIGQGIGRLRLTQ